MTTIDLDRRGNVVVNIGGERVRVSSTILSHASPVFAAMFGSGFKETVTAQTTTANPVNITLPEDDLNAFVVLCEIIHLQTDKMLLAPQLRNIQELEKLRVLADKYQCVAKIKPFAELQLLNLLSLLSGDQKAISGRPRLSLLLAAER
jgi:hypothetical protein